MEVSKYRDKSSYKTKIDIFFPIILKHLLLHVENDVFLRKKKKDSRVCITVMWVLKLGTQDNHELVS